VSFGTPLLLLLLLLVPLTLIFVIVVHRRRARYQIAYTNLDLLATVVEQRRSIKRWIPLVLLLLALAFAATAIARPRAKLKTTEENATIVLVVDVSGSMRANDVKPSRLDAAVNAMQTFLKKVPSKYNVGLVAFSSTSEILQTPTRDRAALQRALGYLAPEAGTALGDGLAMGTKLVVDTLSKLGVQHEPGHYLPGAVILESDGAQNRGIATPIGAAHLAKFYGVRIYGVALGTPNGKVTFGFGLYQSTVPVPPDPATVAMVSRITGGKSFTARTNNQINTVYKDLGSSLGRKTERREISSWFAIAAAVLLVGAVGLSRLWSAPLP
jgi:Ca-activated chloride channel family protein